MILTQPQQLANRLYLAHLDMEDAVRYLHAITDLEELPEETCPPFIPNAIEAVFIAAIVVYSRSFVKSESQGHAAIVLPTRQMFRDEPRLRKAHTQVLDMRQRAAAHTDWAFHGTGFLQSSDGPQRLFWRPDYRKGLELWQLWELFTFVNTMVVAWLITLDVDVITEKKPMRLQIPHDRDPLKLRA